MDDPPGRPTFVFMRKFASLSLHKEGRESAGETPRGIRCHQHSLTGPRFRSNQPRSFTTGPTCQVIRAIPRNGVTSLWLGELFGSRLRSSTAKVGPDRRNFASKHTEFRSCLQFDFNATRVNPLCHDSYLKSVSIFIPSGFFDLSFQGKWLKEDLDFFSNIYYNIILIIISI